MKKKLNYIIILFTLLISTSGFSKTLKPSPYFVHDMEVYFWEVYSRTMELKAPAKIAVQGIFNPSFYSAVLFGEGTFGLGKDADSNIENVTQKRSFFTWMIGEDFLATGDGHPDNTFPASNQNIGNTFLIGGGYYHKNFLIRAGLIYGVYALKDRIYDDTSDQYVDASNYFNYDASTYQSGSGFNRLTNPDGTYTRFLLEFESDFKFIIVKLLNSMNIKEPGNPAFTYIQTSFPMFRKKYYLTPYFSRTSDIEGDLDFKIVQLGLIQKIFIMGLDSWAANSANYHNALYANVNMNYTTADETNLTEKKEEFFIETDLVYKYWAISASYNTEKKQMGLGIGFLMYGENMGDLWIRFKYNPYSAQPVYLRNLTDKGWNIEMGYRINLYKMLGH